MMARRPEPDDAVSIADALEILALVSARFPTRVPEPTAKVWVGDIVSDAKRLGLSRQDYAECGQVLRDLVEARRGQLDVCMISEAATQVRDARRRAAGFEAQEKQIEAPRFERPTGRAAVYLEVVIEGMGRSGWGDLEAEVERRCRDRGIE